MTALIRICCVRLADCFSVRVSVPAWQCASQSQLWRSTSGLCRHRLRRNILWSLSSCVATYRVPNHSSSDSVTCTNVTTPVIRKCGKFLQRCASQLIFRVFRVKWAVFAWSNRMKCLFVKNATMNEAVPVSCSSMRSDSMWTEPRKQTLKDPHSLRHYICDSVSNPVVTRLHCEQKVTFVG